MKRSGLHRKLDYSDYSAMPDDGKRYELLEGALYVTPAPGTAHQHGSKRLFRQMEAYFETASTTSIGEVFYAPIDVILGPHDVVQPDLIVVGRAEQVSQRGIEGAPLVVVEILSPSTADHDRERKASRYAHFGVEHYWIADPKLRTMECFRLEDGRYVLVVRGQGSESLSHPDWPGLTLDLARLWR